MHAWSGELALLSGDGRYMHQNPDARLTPVAWDPNMQPTAAVTQYPGNNKVFMMVLVEVAQTNLTGAECHPIPSPTNQVRELLLLRQMSGAWQLVGRTGPSLGAPQGHTR